MPVYALLLEYNGSKFHGFQKQPGLNTIQGSLENTIQIIQKEPVEIYSAGRTDSGVHSRGMIASFHSKKKIENFPKFIIASNHFSGKHLSIIGMKEVSDSFNAQYSCTMREYEYWIHVSKYPSPLLSGRAYFFQHRFDWEKIRSECVHFLGSNDFTSFTKPSALIRKSPVRNITHLDIVKSKEFENLYKLSIRSSGFLHNMVRIITGTLLDIGKGKINDRNIKEILEKKNRIYAGATIPPHGLYFTRAFYKEFPEIEELYPKINED